MDPSARLRMLFDDADGGLLRTNVGLAPQSKGPEPALQPDLNTINESSMVLASVIPPSPSDSELSGEYEDEYLASLAASAREAREEKRAKAAKLAELNKTKLQTKHMPVDGHAGPELEYAGQHYFCPALAISRFPYKYLRGIVSERVGNAFFDNGKFWARSWKLYVLPC